MWNINWIFIFIMKGQTAYLNTTVCCDVLLKYRYLGRIYTIIPNSHQDTVQSLLLLELFTCAVFD